MSIGAGEPVPLQAEAEAHSVVPASFASQGRSDRVAFDIPEQPLANALDAFGAQADLQVLYESTLAQDRHSTPVIGRFTRDEGLRLLLAGTGLIASYIDTKNVVLHPLVPIALESDAAPVPSAHLALHALRVEAPSGPDFSAYDGVIALDLQKALRRNVKTRHGAYSVSARIWIDGGGVVRRAELISSTGDENRDDAVCHTLQALVVSRLPPENLPEPVMVSIVVKPL
ncbi:MAG TPA: hypothetical protein VFQ52_10395 [Rhizomicrobium sp.]|nr:hypothetical protein [Rhizomicrobium sp.]